MRVGGSCPERYNKSSYTGHEIRFSALCIFKWWTRFLKRKAKFERKQSVENLTWAVCYILTRITEQNKKQINSEPRVGHHLMSTINKTSMRNCTLKAGGCFMTQIGRVRNSSERKIGSCLHACLSKIVH